MAYCFLEVIGVIFYLSFLFERFLVAPFEEYGLKPYRWHDIILTVLGNTAAGMLIMLTTWYAVLHAWMNGFAEMLRFADRMFYKVKCLKEKKTIIVHLFVFLGLVEFNNIRPILSHLECCSTRLVAHLYLQGLHRNCFT